MATQNNILKIIGKTLLIIGILYFGGQGVFLVGALVLCTTEIWPLAILVALIPAFILLKIIIFIVRPHRKSNSSDKESVNMSQETNNVLVDYINQARQRGLSDEHIGHNLKAEGGWSDDDIKEAFSNLNR